MQTYAREMLRLLTITTLAASIIVACASSPEKQTMPPDPPRMDNRAEIDALDKQIGDELAKLDIQPFTASCAANQSCTDAPPPAPTCSNPAPSCTDTCTLGESICKSATRICELAKQLGSLDAYANEKCQHGTESCTAARERCCNCKPS